MTAPTRFASDHALPGTTPGRAGNCFDFLRLVAAFCVVVQHGTAHLSADFLWYHHGSGLWFGDGVAMFFVISGGMVYASAARCREQGRPWRDYLWNRFLRIAPALYLYLFVILVFLLAAGIVSSASLTEPQMLTWLASGLLFVPVYHPAALQDFGIGVLNGSLWTIPAEVSFYLVVPGLVMLAAGRSFRTMLAVAAAVAGVGVVLHALGGGATGEGMASELLAVSFMPWLGFFVLGIWWGRTWSRTPRSGLVALAALVLYVGCVAPRQFAGPELSVLLGLVGGVPLSYLVFWVGHHGPRVLRRTTDRLGDLSFGTYIWHMPVINLLIWAGAADGPLEDTALIGVVIASTAGCALLSWHLVERPALRLKRYSSRVERVAEVPARHEPRGVEAGG